MNLAFGQDRKLRKVRENIDLKQFSEAQKILDEVAEKNATLPSVSYFEALLIFNNPKSLDSVYDKIKFCIKNINNFRYVNNESDSINLGFTKEVVSKFKKQVEDLAFEKYYRFSTVIDSLNMFSSKFDLESSRKEYLNNRICDLAWKNASYKNDILTYKSFISKFTNCNQTANAKSQIESLSWAETKRFNSYKSYEIFILDYPESKYRDSVKLAIEILDWNGVLFKDSISYFENFIVKYPNSNYKITAIFKMDTIRWAPVANKGKLDDYYQFLESYPNSNFSQQAKDSISKFEWFKVAVSQDINQVNDYIKKFPKSNYIDYARKLQDDLLWKINNITSDKVKLQYYLSTCLLCNYEDKALDNLSIIDWQSLKTTKDSSSVLSFIKTYPTSSKLQEARALLKKIIDEADIIELKKMFNIIPIDSFETEEYWISKAPKNSVNISNDYDGQRILAVEGLAFKSCTNENCGDGYVSYNYIGYANLLKYHILTKDINEPFGVNFILVKDKYNFRNLLEGNICDLIKIDENIIRFIIGQGNNEYGRSGFTIFLSKKGDINFVQESDYFDFEKFNSFIQGDNNTSGISFINKNSVKYKGIFINPKTYQISPISGVFSYDNQMKVWKNIKK